MNRRYGHLLLALMVAAIWSVAPDIAYADNCSSLNDCYYTLRAALAAAVGLGVFAALMAIGLDIGPLAGSARKRLKDGKGIDGAEAAVGDEWDESLGLVSLDGLLPRQMGHQVQSPGAPPAASTQVEAPDAQAGEGPEGMRQFKKESADVDMRSSEQMRGEPDPAHSQPGRRGEWSGKAGSRSSAAPDSGDVVDRAQDVTEAFGEPEGMVQSEKPAQASTQSAAPGDAVENELAQGSTQSTAPGDGVESELAQGSTQSTAPGETTVDETITESLTQSEQGAHEMGQQSAKPRQTAPPESRENVVPDSAVGSAQVSPPQEMSPVGEGEYRTGGEGTAAPLSEPAVRQGATLVEEMAEMYRELGRVAGMRTLLQQAAAHGAWAARAAVAHLNVARQIEAQWASSAQGVGRLADVVGRRQAADIVRSDGGIVEVKNYYWAGPAFQHEETVSEATRRLVRQVELLRRRYPGRDIQLAFDHLTDMPAATSAVLRSVGVGIMEVDNEGPNLAAVAGEVFVQRMRATTVEAYGRALLDAGWSDTSAMTARRLRAAFAHDAASAWLALAVCAFDAESIFETNPLGESYTAHIRMLGQTSGEAFRAENVVEEVRGEQLLVAFDNGGRHYERFVALESDYFDTAVLDMVNEAIGDQGEERRFLLLPSPDQFIHLAFMNPEMMARLKAASLIPEDRS